MGSIDLWVQNHILAQLPRLEPIFLGVSDAQYAQRPSRAILISNIGVNSVLQG